MRLDGFAVVAHVVLSEKWRYVITIKNPTKEEEKKTIYKFLTDLYKLNDSH